MNKLILSLAITMALFSASHACSLESVAKCKAVGAAKMASGTTCEALQASIQCSVGESGCYPSYTLLGVFVDAKATCLSTVSALNNCPATVCDSGSMATPMVSLFALVAVMFYKLV
jgi:hypothetical protein